MVNEEHRVVGNLRRCLAEPDCGFLLIAKQRINQAKQVVDDGIAFLVRNRFMGRNGVREGAWGWGRPT